MDCCNGVCSKCYGLKKVVWGALLLLNVWVWPKWLGVDGWVSWIAVLLVIAGVLKVIKPSCGHSVSKEAPARKVRKK